MLFPRRFWGALVALALTAVACGGAAAPTATPTPQRASPTGAATVAPTARPTSAPQAATATPAPAASATTAPAAASRGKIVYAKPVDMGRSNPYSLGGAGGPDTPLISSIYAGLTAFDQDANVIPWLASKWQSSPDGLVLDVSVRQGAIFQDGTPVTAADVVFSANQWLNQPAPPIASIRFSKVEQTSPDVVRFTFARPVAAFLNEITLTEQSGGMGIIPKAAFEKAGSLDAFAKAPIGAGPYRLASRTVGDSLVLESHDKFFNGTPAVKTILVRIAPEDSTRVAMFRTSEADIAESIAPQYLADLEKLPGARIYTVRSGQEVVIHMQLQPDKMLGTDLPNPFRDIRVRQAVQYAVDKKAIVERIAGRAGVAVKGPYSTFHTGTDPDNITDYDYNPEKAKQLLKQANFPFDYTYPVYAYIASAPAPQAVESFANYLQAVGIKAQYKVVEVSSLIRLWRAHEAYPMSMVRSWNVYKEPIVGHYNSYMASDGASSFFADPVMDKLADEASHATSPAQELEATKKFFHYVHDQAYLVDLYAIVDNHGIGPKVDWRYPQGLPSRFDLIKWR